MKTELNLIKLLFIYEVKIWLEHLISKGRSPQIYLQCPWLLHVAAWRVFALEGTSSTI